LCIRELRASFYPVDQALFTLISIPTCIQYTVDAQNTLNEATLFNEVFGNGVDPVNLAERYDTCSFGKLNFVKALDRTGNALTVVNGVETVTLSGYTASQGDAVIRDAVTEELKIRFGVSSRDVLADHVMYCHPPRRTQWHCVCLRQLLEQQFQRFRKF